MSESESLFSRADALVSRFSGVDICGRRFLSPLWPKRWRARTITHKNERSDYRVTGWGDTPDAAAADMMEQISQVDDSSPPPEIATIRQNPADLTATPLTDRESFSYTPAQSEADFYHGREPQVEEVFSAEFARRIEREIAWLHHELSKLAKAKAQVVDETLNAVESPSPPYLAEETVGEIVRWIDRQHLEAARETPPNTDYMKALQLLGGHVESALHLYRKSKPNKKAQQPHD